MSPMDWFGIGYIVVSIIVIIVYLGVYFGWFWGGIIMKYILIKTIIEGVTILSVLYFIMIFLCSL